MKHDIICQFTMEQLVFTARMAPQDAVNAGCAFIIWMVTSSDEVWVCENETSGFRGGFFHRSRQVGRFDASMAFIGA